MSLNVWITAITLGVVALALLNVAWLLAVRRFYRLRAEPGEVLRVTTSDGWVLGVHYRRAKTRRYLEPVVLAHGLAANHRNLDFEPPFSLAHAFNEAGFDTYSVDWRGTMHSEPPPRGKLWGDYSVDDHVEKDAPALIQLALGHSGAKQVFWVGHSLGGLIGYATAGGEQAEKIRGVVTIGSPVFFKYKKLIHFAVQLGALTAWPFRFRNRIASIAVAPFLGHVTLPLSDTIVNPKHIPPHIQRKAYANVMSSMSRRVLVQFRDWIKHDAFRSFDGKTDYRERIARLSASLLITAGSSDKLATPDSVQRAFELAGTKDKTLVIFGPENGDRQHYGHGDLLFGANAPTEVFPVILRWTQTRASAYGESSRQAEGGTSSTV